MKILLQTLLFIPKRSYTFITTCEDGSDTNYKQYNPTVTCFKYFRGTFPRLGYVKVKKAGGIQ